MKPATVTFKNGKPENGDRAITITPTGFTAPLLVTQIDTTFAHAVLNNQTQSLKFTVTEAAYLGNIGTPTGDTAKVSISIQEKKIIIKVKNKDYLPATLQIPNRSDSTKVSTIKITGVIDKKYEGEDVWCYGDVLDCPQGCSYWYKSCNSYGHSMPRRMAYTLRLDYCLWRRQISKNLKRITYLQMVPTGLS